MVMPVRVERPVEAGAFQADDPRWLDRLFEEHLDFVVRSLLRLGVVSRDAEDAAQQVFVIAHQNRARIVHLPNARTWLWSVARRVASDHRALARHRIELDAGKTADRLSHGPDLDASLSARDLVHRALAELPEERREVLILYEMEGMTLAEIAELDQTPLQTVASRLKVARSEFARAVERLQGGAS